mmetsp:Transcript_65000/g.121055  ORF Transcript_65000/g.121055 Transcript_65000/m.121055 type:complete len:220 (+) Transcript_65000:635-1294(+)
MASVAMRSSSSGSLALGIGFRCSTTHLCSAFLLTLEYKAYWLETSESSEGCCMITWQSGQRMFLNVNLRPPVLPFRTSASAQCWCSTCPHLSCIAGAARKGSIQQIPHHSSPSGTGCPPCSGACLPPQMRQGRHESSPRTPPHQCPHSCLLPHARLSFSAHDSAGGNLSKFVPSSQPQQELTRISERRRRSMQDFEHHRQEGAASFATCRSQPSHDQPQ